MLSLEKIREEIDKVDDAILLLLEKRAQYAKGALEIKKAKAGNNKPIPIYFPLREEAILERLVKKSHGKLPAQMVKRIFEEILQSCRELQFNKNAQNPGSYAHLIKIMVQGAKGGGSEQAALKYCNCNALKHFELIYETSSDRVLASLASRKAHYSIVPFVNVKGELVESTIDALRKHSFFVIESIKVNVLLPCLSDMQTCSKLVAIDDDLQNSKSNKAVFLLLAPVVTQ